MVMVVMRMALVVGLASSTGCTLGAPLATVSVIALHNEAVSDHASWSYTTPILVSAGIGLAIDAFLIFAKGWSRSMT